MQSHPTTTPRRRRRRIAALGAAVVAALTAGVSLTVPAEAHTTKPTIVLVHGAWADSTSWDKVTRELKDDGYRTVTPELGLNSVAEDVAIVRTALNKISGRKVLVSHSYGGIVTAGASHGRTDISAFVYAAALVPDEGDSIASLGADFIPSEAFGHLVFTGEPFASPAFHRPGLLPPVLRSGPQQATGSRIERRPAAAQFLDRRNTLRPRRLAQRPVLVRRVRSGPHDRPGRRTLDGGTRRRHRRRIPDRQSRRRNHPAGITLHRTHRTRGELNPSEVTPSSAPPQRSSSLARPVLRPGQRVRGQGRRRPPMGCPRGWGGTWRPRGNRSPGLRDSGRSVVRRQTRPQQGPDFGQAGWRVLPAGIGRRVSWSRLRCRGDPAGTCTPSPSRNQPWSHIGRCSIAYDGSPSAVRADT